MQQTDVWTLGYHERAAKRVRAGVVLPGTAEIDRCDVIEVELYSLEHLAHALRSVLPGEFFMSGRVIRSNVLAPGRRWPNSLHVERLLHARPNRKAGFEYGEHRMIVFDIDQAEGDHIAQTLEERVQFARNLLPDQFRGAECVGAVTASAGFKKGLRVRLFFWNDRPYLLKDLKRYFRPCPFVDDSIYSAVQPVFIAGPLIEDNTPDPFPQRVIHIPGAQLSFDPTQPSPYKIERPDAPLDVTALALPDKRTGFDWHADAPEGGRNNTVFQAACAAYGSGLDFEPGLAQVLAYNQLHCKPPLDTHEVERTTQSAYSNQLPPRPEGELRKQLQKEIKQLVSPTALEETLKAAIPHFEPLFQSGLSVKAAIEELLAFATKHKAEPLIVQQMQPLIELHAQSKPPVLERWQMLLAYSDDGEAPKQTLSNVQVLLREHPEIRTVSDVVTRKLFWIQCPWNPSLQGHEVQKSAHQVDLKVWVARRLGDGPAADKYAWDALIASSLAPVNQINYLAARLRSLQWDGVQRLQWLAYWLFGCESTLENRALHLWFAQAVRRAFNPGSPADHTIILRGVEDLGKSHWLESLSMGDHTLISNLPKDFDSKDTAMKIRGRLVVTADELEALRGKEAEQAKEFLTRRRDEVRLPYEADEISLPRTCSFIASTNEADFLTSNNGNRRFVVLECRRETPRDQITTELAKQCWAEAVATYEQVPPLTTEEKGERRERIQQYVVDVEAEMTQQLRGWIEDGCRLTTGDQLPAGWADRSRVHTLSSVLIAKQMGWHPDHRTFKRIARVLRELGWRNKHTERGKVWTRA